MLAIPENEPGSAVKAKALQLALKQLDALGAKYAVVMPDGTKHGSLEVQPQKTGKRNVRPRGELKTYVQEQLQDMTPGDVKVIERSYWNVWSINSTIKDFADKNWGEKSIVVEVKAADGTIEVLRVA